MYRLATKRTNKNESKKTRTRVFFLREPRLQWFIACYVLLLTEIVRGLWSVTVTLEWIEFGCVHNVYPEESDCVPPVRKPKLVTETGLIVLQYDRLSQQQFLVIFATTLSTVNQVSLFWHI